MELAGWKKSGNQQLEHRLCFHLSPKHTLIYAQMHTSLLILVRQCNFLLALLTLFLILWPCSLLFINKDFSIRFFFCFFFSSVSSVCNSVSLLQYIQKQCFFTYRAVFRIENLTCVKRLHHYLYWES